MVPIPTEKQKRARYHNGLIYRTRGTQAVFQHIASSGTVSDEAAQLSTDISKKISKLLEALKTRID